jgi:hypothetical protein
MPFGRIVLERASTRAARSIYRAGSSGPTRRRRTAPSARGVCVDVGQRNCQARFFDLIGWRWTYEPFDADGWIPDFLIGGAAPLLIEVGPCVVLSDFSAKAADGALAYAKERPDLPTLILGVGPNALWDGRFYDPAGYLTDDSYGSGTDVGCWARCRKCGSVGVFHESGVWQLRPCGHGDGDHYLGDFSEAEYIPLWRDAGNRTQWQPRRAA